MNKPNPDLRSGAEEQAEPFGPLDDLGPLDEHGQQIWSPETEAAIARLHADPEYWTGIEEALADVAAGRLYTSEEMEAHAAERKRRGLAERGL